jgi:NADH:ubiquinone oxidoreductase subunit 2 (subunit N)
MSAYLQHYILTVLVNPSGSGRFFALHSNNVEFAIGTSSFEPNLNSSLVGLFLLSDALLYFSIILLIYVIGSKYYNSEPSLLPAKLLNLSVGSLYASTITNLFALVKGYNVLALCSLSLFDGSYTFGLFSQLSKLIVLILMGCLYSLFNITSKLKVQSTELVLLTQIAVALCCAAVSSTNFALLLLALEGFSLILYIMTTMGRNYGGITAAVKYFTFGTLGSVFLF